MDSPTLLAWCSKDANKIDIVDLNTKESYASFDGAKVSYEGKIQFFNYFEADMQY